MSSNFYGCDHEYCWLWKRSPGEQGKSTAGTSGLSHQEASISRELSLGKGTDVFPQCWQDLAICVSRGGDVAIQSPTNYRERTDVQDTIHAPLQDLVISTFYPSLSLSFSY